MFIQYRFNMLIVEGLALELECPEPCAWMRLDVTLRNLSDTRNLLRAWYVANGKYSYADRLLHNYYLAPRSLYQFNNLLISPGDWFVIYPVWEPEPPGLAISCNATFATSP